MYKDLLQGFYIWHTNFTQTIFSSDLFNDLHIKAINWRGTVRPNLKVMPSDFGKKCRLKWGDIKTRVKCNLTAVAWKDKRHINILTNVHQPPAEGNVCG
jgi:hypothetical protein